MYSRAEFGLSGFCGAVAFLLSLPLALLRRLFRVSSTSSFSNESLLNSSTSSSSSSMSSRLHGKIAVVTGANCGVGFHSALMLLKSGARVVIGCRSRARGEAAVSRMQALLGDNECKLEIIQLDLTDFKSIEAFSQTFKSKYDHLDILINNAGINTSGVTDYGLQETFSANYLGHFYLFQLLEPLLSAVTDRTDGSSARVVNLSSVMHHVGLCDYRASAYYGTGPHMSLQANNCYADSKLYMNLMTMEINKRFYFNNAANGIKRRRVSAVSVNPGAVRRFYS